MTQEVMSHSGLVGRPMTAEQYELLVAAGVYEGQSVELLDGIVADMSPQGPRHGNAVSRISTRLVVRLSAAFGERYLVRPQTPLSASDIATPEPDIAIVDWDSSTADAHPHSAHLIIEIAQSSHERDLDTKPVIYAGAAVAQYWVIDLVAREVVVHTDPLPADPVRGRPATYGTVRHLPWDTELDVLGLTLQVSDLI